jgi:hypothetical protein
MLIQTGYQTARRCAEPIPVAGMAMTTTFGTNQHRSFNAWTGEVHEDSLRLPTRSMTGAW